MIGKYQLLSRIRSILRHRNFGHHHITRRIGRFGHQMINEEKE